jgi:hypothetical protein
MATLEWLSRSQVNHFQAVVLHDFLTDYGHSVPILFFVLVFYVFEVQLLMQIIINRIAVVIENRRWIAKVKVYIDLSYRTSLNAYCY